MARAELGSRIAAFYFKIYMQLAVHLSTCFLTKLEFINQTPIFPQSFTNNIRKMYLHCMKKKKTKVREIWEWNAGTFIGSKYHFF